MEDFRKQTLDLTKEIEANAKLELENLQAFSSNEEKIHRQVRVCVEEEFILQTAQQDLKGLHVKCLQYGPAVILCSSLSCALCPRSFSALIFQHHTCVVPHEKKQTHPPETRAQAHRGKNQEKDAGAAAEKRL